MLLMIESDSNSIHNATKIFVFQINAVLLNFSFKESWKIYILVSTNIKQHKSLNTIKHPICILKWFLKDHMTLNNSNFIISK